MFAQAQTNSQGRRGALGQVKASPVASRLGMVCRGESWLGRRVGARQGVSCCGVARSVEVRQARLVKARRGTASFGKVRQGMAGVESRGVLWPGMVRQGMAGEAWSVPVRQGWSRYGPDGQARRGPLCFGGLWLVVVSYGRAGMSSLGESRRVKARFDKARQAWKPK